MPSSMPPTPRSWAAAASTELSITRRRPSSSPNSARPAAARRPPVPRAGGRGGPRAERARAEGREPPPRGWLSPGVILVTVVVAARIAKGGPVGAPWGGAPVGPRNPPLRHAVVGLGPGRDI